LSPRVELGTLSPWQPRGNIDQLSRKETLRERSDPFSSGAWRRSRILRQSATYADVGNPEGTAGALMALRLAGPLPALEPNVGRQSPGAGWRCPTLPSAGEGRPGESGAAGGEVDSFCDSILAQIATAGLSAAHPLIPTSRSLLAISQFPVSSRREFRRKSRKLLVIPSTISPPQAWI